MWWALDAEVVMEGGRIVRTRNPTGHAVLVDARFEIPCGKFGCIESVCVAFTFLNRQALVFPREN